MLSNEMGLRVQLKYVSLVVALAQLSTSDKIEKIRETIQHIQKIVSLLRSTYDADLTICFIPSDWPASHLRPPDFLGATHCNSSFDANDRLFLYAAS